jgi:hypothetical protein
MGCIPHVRSRGEEIEKKTRTLILSQSGEWLRFATLGLTALESSWYGMKKWIGVISGCSCWPLLSSSYEKSSDKIRAILFTDKFLI